jgi:hypothetical protein
MAVPDARNGLLAALAAYGGAVRQQVRVSPSQFTPQPIAVLNVQPQRLLHLVQQLHRELYVVAVASPFLDRSTLMLDETLPVRNMSLCFQEMLREASSVTVHHVSSEVRLLQQDMCQTESATEHTLH